VELSPLSDASAVALAFDSPFPSSLEACIYDGGKKRGDVETSFNPR